MLWVSALSEIAGLCFATVFPTVATWLYFSKLHGTPGVNIVYAICKVVQFTLPLVFLVVSKRKPLGKKDTGDGVALGVAFGLLAAAVIGLGYLFLHSQPFGAEVGLSIRAKLAGYGVKSAYQFLALAIGYCVFHSLLEEYYWRWFLFGRLRTFIPRSAAIVVSSLGFMSHHVLIIGGFLGGYGWMTWVTASSIALAGAFWAFLFERNQSLTATWISHALVDAAIMAVGFELWRL